MLIGGALTLVSRLGVSVFRIFVITFTGYDNLRYLFAVQLGLFAAWYGAIREISRDDRSDDK